MTSPAALLAWLRAHEQEMFASLEGDVALETPTADKAALDAMGDRLARRFSAANAAVKRIPNVTAGDALVVRTGRDTGQRQGLVLCHFDTVWPAGTLAARPYRVDAEGRAWGPGVYDMKSGIVMVEYALRAIAALEATLPRPVTLLLTADEETGSRTSRALIEAEARTSDYTLVLESPLADGSLKTARKGIGRFTIDVTGKAVHAGVEPEKGANAIVELAHQVLAVTELTDYSRGLTVNVGVITGGNVSNQVPAIARAEVDVRVRSAADAAAVEQRFAALTSRVPGTAVRVEGGFHRPPMERTDAIGRLFEAARAIGAEVGLDLSEAATGGASDGNFAAAVGCPVLDGLGAEGDGAHAEHEHVRLASMAPRAALLASLLLRL